MLVGDTLREPNVGTVPISGVITTLSALVNDHLKVVLLRHVIEVGEADIVTYPDGISTNRQLYSALDPSSHVEAAVPVVAEAKVSLAVQRSPSS